MPQTLDYSYRASASRQLGVAARTASRRVDHDLLAHVSPTLLDHITRFDTHVEAESERTGYRPLRVPAAE